MTAYAAPYTDATAVMGRRLAAYVIDGLVGVVIILAIAVPIFASKATAFPTNGDTRYCDRYNHDSVVRCAAVGDQAYVLAAGDQNVLLESVYGGAATWLLLNAVVLQGLTGGSVGKLVTGLRVVRPDGGRAGVAWCALRTLILPIDAFLFGVIGLVTTLSTAGHRRLGDMAASTLVVDRHFAGQPPPVPRLDGAPMPGLSAGGQPFNGPHTSPSATGDGPTWDAARAAYIQYDRGRSAWVQWSEMAREWRPIDQ